MSIRVELVEARGEPVWPRPGRLFAASTAHTFGQLATAIDIAFARWDQSHLHEFELPGGVRIGPPDPDNDETLDERRQTLSKLRTDKQFVYSFDLGDDLAHLCTLLDENLDPREVLGSIPPAPTPYFGWGPIPDQYGRMWADDDGESPTPPDPGLSDLPPLRPDWGAGV